MSLLLWQVNERLRLLSERGRGRGRGRFGGPGRPPYEPRPPERDPGGFPEQYIGGPRSMLDRLGPGPAGAHPLSPMGPPGGRRGSFEHDAGRLEHGGRGDDGTAHAGALHERRPSRLASEGSGRFGEPSASEDTYASPSPRWAHDGAAADGRAQRGREGSALGTERAPFLDRVREPLPLPPAPVRRRVLSTAVVDGQQITAASSVRCLCLRMLVAMRCAAWLPQNDEGTCMHS